MNGKRDALLECQNAKRISFRGESAAGITHEKLLKDCNEEFKTFLTTILGKKLGPLLFQFDKYALMSLHDLFLRG